MIRLAAPVVSTRGLPSTIEVEVARSESVQTDADSVPVVIHPSGEHKGLALHY